MSDYQDYIEGRADHQLMVEEHERNKYENEPVWSVEPVTQYGPLADPPMWKIKAHWLNMDEMAQFAHALLTEVEIAKRGAEIE